RTAPLSARQSAADSAAEVAIVAEYRAWAMRLRDSGALVMAEKLADDPVTMLASTGATELPHGTSAAHRADVSCHSDRKLRACGHPAAAGPVPSASATQFESSVISPRF